MKGRRAVILAALVALLAATAAQAATKTLKGQVRSDEKSSVALRVKGKGEDRRVKSFVAKDFLISCRTGQARLQSAMISGPVPVNGKGRFGVTGSSGRQQLEVTGRLTGRRKARGTVRYSGPTEVDGATEACDSGELAWVAKR